MPLLPRLRSSNRSAALRRPKPAPMRPSWPLLAESLVVTGAPHTLKEFSEALRRHANDQVGQLDEVHFSQEEDHFHRMALWRSPADLRAFVELVHSELLAYHGKAGAFPTVERTLWWIPAGTEITPEEARARTEHLRVRGPGRHAFTLASPVHAPALF